MALKIIRPAYYRGPLAAAAALLTMAATAGPASADTAVTCTYTVSSWQGGFTANVDIANGGPAINGWTVRWTFTTPTANITAWSAVISEQGATQATATNMSWNGVIPSGSTASFGWSAAAVSTGIPTDLTINGIPC